MPRAPHKDLYMFYLETEVHPILISFVCPCPVVPRAVLCLRDHHPLPPLSSPSLVSFGSGMTWVSAF